MCKQENKKPKMILRNNSWTLSRSDENHAYKHPRNSETSGRINAKRSITRHMVGICWKPRSTTNTWKVEKKTTHYWQDNLKKINRWPIWGNTDGKALGWFCQGAKRKQLSARNPLSGETNFQKWKWNKNIPRGKKTWGNLLLTDLYLEKY